MSDIKGYDTSADSVEGDPSKRTWTMGYSSHKCEKPEHYKMKIEPTEFILKNELGWCEGNVVKYVSRWRECGGVDDLKKAISYIERLIEEYG